MFPSTNIEQTFNINFVRFEGGVCGGETSLRSELVPVLDEPTSQNHASQASCCCGTFLGFPPLTVACHPQLLFLYKPHRYNTEPLIDYV